MGDMNILYYSLDLEYHKYLYVICDDAFILILLPVWTTGIQYGNFQMVIWYSFLTFGKRTYFCYCSYFFASLLLMKLTITWCLETRMAANE